MVHVERYQPDNVRNGRSRGPSPNGHNTPDTSDDDSTKNAKGNKSSKGKSEYEEKIRVGKDYQTVCPDYIPPHERKLEALSDRALLVWSPTKDIPDNKLEDYITVAKDKYGYNGEQALGMLFWHKHDLERAVMDLANFTPFPDEWTEEDKVLFEQAFHFHGKSFHRIRQMLPDKNIASLVKYYYSWKKSRQRTSVMDRQEKLKAKEGSENGSENGSNEDSDSEDKIDLVDDIPNSKEDEDMDDVMVVESTPSPSPPKLKSVEPMDSISITAISSSSNNVSSHQPQEPVPEVTISPAPSSLSSLSTSGQTSIAVNSSVSTSIIAMVEQAKAAAV